MKKVISFSVLISLLLLLSPSVAMGEVQQSALYARFIEQWEFYFGKPPEITATFDKTEQFSEIQFRKIWEIYSQFLPVEERISAEAAFRYRLLNDNRALLNALNSCFYSSRLYPQKNGGILFYLFAEEEIADPSIAPQILPPGENGSKFMETLNLFGESEANIRTRMAVFILKKMVENKVLRQTPSTLPIMFTLTQRLKDSEFMLARIPVSSEYFSIKGELKGDLKNIKVISLFVDRNNNVEKIGVSQGSNSPLLMPSENGTLLLAIFNASSEEQGDLLSATFWKDFNPPVSVVSAKVEDSFLRVSVEENGGILGYKIESSQEKDGKTEEISSFIKSNGTGSNDYLFSLENGDSTETTFYLKIFTLGGFAYKIPLYLEK